jgi:DNA (cytosine-5)-methyltransferase 1
MKKFKIVDLFCGAGGLSVGFEDAGFETLLAIDNSTDAINTFNSNRKKEVAISKDIKSIDKVFFDEINLGLINGVIGGPPCQGFSLAGDRIIDDERNELYRDFFKVVEILTPEFYVIENVTGILSLNNGVVKDDILNRANKLGYNGYFKVLNSVNFGVPQNRKRVFFVCIKKELEKNRIFKFPNELSIYYNSEDAISDLPSLEKSNQTRNYKFEPKNNYQREMRIGSDYVENHEQTNHKEETVKLISYLKPGQSIKHLPPNLRGSRKYTSLLRRMDNSKPSNTIDTGHRTYFHYKENRIISVRESARLQSFVDNYHFKGSKISQFKQVGNAVPPKLSYALANQIMLYLYKGGKK